MSSRPPVPHGADAVGPGDQGGELVERRAGAGHVAQKPDRVVAGRVGEAEARRRGETGGRRRAVPRAARRWRAVARAPSAPAPWHRRQKSMRPPVILVRSSRNACGTCIADQREQHRHRRHEEHTIRPQARWRVQTASRAAGIDASAAGCARLEDARDQLAVAVDVGADLQHRDAPVAAGQRRQLRLRHDRRLLDGAPRQPLVRRGSSAPSRRTARCRSGGGSARPSGSSSERVMRVHGCACEVRPTRAPVTRARVHSNTAKISFIASIWPPRVEDGTRIGVARRRRARPRRRRGCGPAGRTG